MSEEAKEIPDTRVAVCGSTHCRFNDNLACTAESVEIGSEGKCRSEDWGNGRGK